LTVFTEKLNWVRAAVLGSNDGIVSVGALLFGMAAATKPSALLVVAAIVAGAASMALGEYVSVHSQVDAEREAGQLVTVSPIRAALSSAGSFVMGSSLPAAAIELSPQGFTLPLAFTAVLLSLTASGFLSARLSNTPPLKPTIRVVAGGALALLITYTVGALFS
jgi:vacuolar iron transporter family protein